MLTTLMGMGPFTVANILRDKATRAGSTATISGLAFHTPLAALVLLAILDVGVVTVATILGTLLAITGAFLSSSSK
ncbi:MAG: hypothetical protein V7695_05835 [Sulfitobacter sp.]